MSKFYEQHYIQFQNTKDEIGQMTVDAFQTACETNNIDCDVYIDTFIYDLATALMRSKANGKA